MREFLLQEISRRVGASKPVKGRVWKRIKPSKHLSSGQSVPLEQDAGKDKGVILATPAPKLAGNI